MRKKRIKSSGIFINKAKNADYVCAYIDYGEGPFKKKKEVVAVMHAVSKNSARVAFVKYLKKHGYKEYVPTDGEDTLILAYKLLQKLVGGPEYEEGSDIGELKFMIKRMEGLLEESGEKAS